MTKKWWKWFRDWVNYKNQPVQKKDKLVDFDTPIIGKTLEYLTGWQVTTISGIPIERQRVLILRMEGIEDIVLTPHFASTLTMAFKRLTWNDDAIEVQGKDIIF